jgi:hypothetical protein
MSCVVTLSKFIYKYVRYLYMNFDKVLTQDIRLV